MRDVIDAVFDQDSTFEVQPGFGQSVVCTLARLGGHAVAVVANQPRVYRRLDRRRRRRQGCTLHHCRRLLPPAARLPVRQPGGSAGIGVRAAGHPAERGAHVRGADPGDVAEVRGDVAQGVRLRLHGDGHDPVRRPIGRVRLPRRHDGRDGGGGDEPGDAVPTSTRPSFCATPSSKRRTARPPHSASTS